MRTLILSCISDSGGVPPPFRAPPRGEPPAGPPPPEPRLAGDPGDPVFLFSRELKKLARTPSPPAADALSLASIWEEGEVDFLLLVLFY